MVLGVFICDVPSRLAKAGVAQDAEGGKVRDAGLRRRHYECIRRQAVLFRVCGSYGPGTVLRFFCYPSL